MFKVLFIALVLVQAAFALQRVSIGDRIDRSYTKYVSMPITVKDAAAAGFTRSIRAFDENLGYEYALGGSAGDSDPISLFFTNAGQLAGVAVTAYEGMIVGKLPQYLKDAGFWRPEGSGVYKMYVSFRNSSEIVSTFSSDMALGDRVVINAHTIAFEVPVTENEVALNYTKGSCFQYMGTHYFLDLTNERSGGLTWQAAHLMPVVPMYNNGYLHAIFFASPVVQQGLTSAHWWDPIPLVNGLMCKNFCSSSCTFSDTSIWSTFHLFLRDRNLASCPNGCTIGCC